MKVDKSPLALLDTHVFYMMLHVSGRTCKCKRNLLEELKCPSVPGKIIHVKLRVTVVNNSITITNFNIIR